MYLQYPKIEFPIDICEIKISITRGIFLCQTNVNSRPLFAQDACHRANNSVLLSVPTDVLGALAWKVAQSNSSHWIYPPGSMTIMDGISSEPTN